MTDGILSPSDAAVAVRSFPRRFRGVFARPEGDDRFDPDEVARRAGSDGRSALDHLTACERVLDVTAVALARGGRGASVPADAGDLASLAPGAGPTPVGDALDAFDATAARTATAIDAVPTDAWGAEVAVDGGGTRQLLDLLRDAVAAASGHLRAAERTVAEVT